MSVFRRSLFIAVTGAAITVGAATAPANAQNSGFQQGDWVSLTGTIDTTVGDYFIVDYGAGRATIEMDDWDWYPDIHKLLVGDRVTVYGTIDKTGYVDRVIEAGSVYVHNRNTYYFANAADGENLQFAVSPVITVPDSSWGLRGKVTDVDEAREFVMESPFGTIRVDASELAYNPFDEAGGQQITEGDWLVVYGELDTPDWFGEGEVEVEAESIISLSRDPGKSESLK